MTPEEVRQLRDDLFVVIMHVAADEHGDYLIHHPRGSTLRVLLGSLPRLGLGESMEARHFAELDKVLGWVGFTMQWRQRERPLSAAEQEVQAAATRLFDALHPPRTH